MPDDFDGFTKEGEPPPTINCNVWGLVDFGEGKVRIRCTRTWEHDEHFCNVALIQPEETYDPQGVSGTNLDSFETPAE